MNKLKRGGVLFLHDLCWSRHRLAMCVQRLWGLLSGWGNKHSINTRTWLSPQQEEVVTYSGA